MFIFCLGWIIITLRLYKIFGWNVFKQLGADIGVRSKLITINELKYIYNNNDLIN